MTGITIKNRNGDVIDFDIVVPTSRGILYAYCFIRDAEIAPSSTRAEIKININKAHTLMSHGSNAIIWQTVAQLEWTITQGTLKPCKHYKKPKDK